MYSPTEMGFEDVGVGVEVDVVHHSFAAVHGCQQQICAGPALLHLSSRLRLVCLQLGQRLPNLPQLGGQVIRGPGVLQEWKSLRGVLLET